MSEDKKVHLAKEIKTNSKLLLYAILIGALSFSVIFYQNLQEVEKERARISARLKGDIFWNGTFSQSKAEEAASDSMPAVLLIIAASTSALIIGRYIGKGIKWVDKNSRK